MRVLPIVFLLLGLMKAFSAEASSMVPNAPIVKVLGMSHERKFVLQIDALTTEAELTMTDRAGLVLLREAIIGHGTYRKLYNVTALPKGQYSIVIRTAQRKIEQPFTVTEHGVRVVDEQLVTYLPSLKRNDAGTYDLNFLNQQGTSVQVSLINATQDRTVIETINNEVTITRRYDFANWPAGKYDLEVKVADEQYRLPLELL